MQITEYNKASIKEQDLILWKRYKRTKNLADRAELLKRLDGVIQNYVNKWVGPINRSVLLSKAKVLVIKALDTYDPNKGTALATHVTNAMAPLSRTVYTFSNTARLPENVTLQVNTFNMAKDSLLNTLGRDPTPDELHQELGWTIKDINRIETYMRRDLTESAGSVGETFFDTLEDDDYSTLAAIYFDLLPNEKILFEHTTGFNGKKKMNNSELIKLLKINQAQLSYQKTLLQKKIHTFLDRNGRR